MDFIENQWISWIFLIFRDLYARLGARTDSKTSRNGLPRHIKMISGA